MSNISAAELAQRAIDAKLMTASELEFHCGTLDIRDVELHEFIRLAIDQKLLTNFQISRLIDGEGDGFFYGRNEIKYLVATEERARVYRGEHVDTRQRVTIKVLRLRFNNDPVAREQFAREAKHNGCRVAIDRDRTYMVIDSRSN